MTDKLTGAKEAIDAKRFDHARQVLTPIANAGVAEAQYLLGYLFFTSAEVDPVECRKWLERAARQDHPEALYHLSCWASDEVVQFPADRQQQDQLVRAAELGCVEAQCDLGCAYALGEDGWSRDLELARKWYGEAAANGHADAQYNYGLMLLLGEGGPLDRSGLDWIERSAKQGDIAAIDYLNLTPQ